MYIITHRIKTSTDFMDRYLPYGAAGGLFLADKLGMKPGGRICLELILDWVGEIYYPVAIVERVGVIWDSGGRKLKGAIVRFAETETETRDHLLEVVRRSTGGYQPREAPRLSAALQVQCFDAGTRNIEGRVADLSVSGALVETTSPLPAGSDVHLRFEDPARGVMHHVRGRVVRLDFSGASPGMGVRFRFGSRRERRAMARLCTHLARRAA